MHTDRTKFDVVVKAQGPQKQEVVWVPAIDTKTFCDLDYTYWPWDVQYCKYSVGSWTAFGDQVDVNMHGNVSRNYAFTTCTRKISTISMDSRRLRSTPIINHKDGRRGKSPQRRTLLHLNSVRSFLKVYLYLLVQIDFLCSAELMILFSNC